MIGMKFNNLKRRIKNNIFLYSFIHTLYIPFREIKLFRIKISVASQSIELIKKSINSKSTIYFFGVPIHKNLGDFAQTFCIERYFEKYYPDYELIMLKSYSAYSKKFLKCLDKKINENDLIAFQSGYCTTDYHLDHTMHKILVNRYKNIRILFFPQTVFFSSAHEKKVTSKCFNLHQKLVFLARDEISYATAKEMFPKNIVRCYPDIVTSLIGSEINHEVRNGVLLCMRDDYEKSLSEEDILNLKNELLSFVSLVEISDTTCDDLNIQYITENLETVIMNEINLLKRYLLIITDRFHGTIFSLIANVPVIVLPSRDHKVVSGVDWFTNVYDCVYFAKSVKEAVQIAKTIVLQNNTECNNAPYFEEKYYSVLRPLVDSLKDGD